jgi:hypothetical protein
MENYSNYQKFYGVMILTGETLYEVYLLMSYKDTWYWYSCY